MIKLYGASWCKPCKETKSFLDDNKVEYTYVDVDEKENQRLIIDKEISSIPYIEVYENDELIDTYTGSVTTDIELKVLLCKKEIK